MLRILKNRIKSSETEKSKNESNDKVPDPILNPQPSTSGASRMQNQDENMNDTISSEEFEGLLVKNRKSMNKESEAIDDDNDPYEAVEDDEEAPEGDDDEEAFEEKEEDDDDDIDNNEEEGENPIRDLNLKLKAFKNQRKDINKEIKLLESQLDSTKSK